MIGLSSLQMKLTVGSKLKVESQRKLMRTGISALLSASIGKHNEVCCLRPRRSAQHYGSETDSEQLRSQPNPTYAALPLTGQNGAGVFSGYQKSG